MGINSHILISLTINHLCEQEVSAALKYVYKKFIAFLLLSSHSKNQFPFPRIHSARAMFTAVSAWNHLLNSQRVPGLFTASDNKLHCL